MDGDSRDGGGGGGCKDAGSEDYENLPTSVSLSIHMTAGAMAGILEHSVMYPVDSVKVRREGTLGTERAERRARARAFASRAGAAWMQLSETALSSGPRRPGSPGSHRELARVAGAPRSALRSSFRCAPGPWGHPPRPRGCPSRRPAPPLPPSSRPGLLAALRPARRSGERRWPRWWRRGSRGRRPVQLCTVLPLSGHAIGEFAVPGRCGSSWHSRCPSRGERRPPAGAGWPRLPTRALSRRDPPPGALTTLAPRNVSPVRPARPPALRLSSR